MHCVCIHISVYLYPVLSAWDHAFPIWDQYICILLAMTQMKYLCNAFIDRALLFSFQPSASMHTFTTTECSEMNMQSEGTAISKLQLGRLQKHTRLFTGRMKHTLFRKDK